MRMEQGFFHMRLFLLCSNLGSEEFPEKPYDLSEKNTVSQKFCEDPDLHSASISPSLYTQWPTVQGKHWSVWAVLYSDLRHNYPGGSALSIWDIRLAQQALRVYTDPTFTHSC